jgi:tRNA(Met) C34 N-acetyltransferase TmcA
VNVSGISVQAGGGEATARELATQLETEHLELVRLVLKLQADERHTSDWVEMRLLPHFERWAAKKRRRDAEAKLRGLRRRLDAARVQANAEEAQARRRPTRRERLEALAQRLREAVRCPRSGS